MKKIRTAQQSLIKQKGIVRVYNHANVNGGKTKTVVLHNSANKVVEAMKDYTGRILAEIKHTLDKSNSDVATTIELVDKLVELNNTQQWQK